MGKTYSEGDDERCQIGRAMNCKKVCSKLKTASYLRQYRCYICKKKIHAKQRYYDGGHGLRAHEKCLKPKGQ